MAKETIRTFLSQGAAAGAACNFFWLIFLIFHQPNFYNILLLWYIPLALASGAIMGAVFGAVVWLAEQRLKQALRWWLKVLLAAGWCAVFAATKNALYSHLLVYAVVLAALVSLLAGSKIHVVRILVFGAGQSNLSFAQVNSFSFVANLLLRIGSLCGLLVSLFMLAYALSITFAPSGSFDNTALKEVLIESIVAIVYFTGSIYVTSARPRRSLVVRLGLVWNVPLAIWMLRPPDHGIAEVDFVGVVAWIFICLWIVVVVGRLISSDETDRIAPAENGLSGLGTEVSSCKAEQEAK